VGKPEDKGGWDNSKDFFQNNFPKHNLKFGITCTVADTFENFMQNVLIRFENLQGIIPKFF